MNKVEDILAQSKLYAMLRREENEQKTKHCIMVALAIVGAVALVALISYAVYRLMFEDEYEDFDDDEMYFDDDDLEDLFDYDDEEEEAPAEEPAETEEAPAEAPAEE